VFNCSVVRLVVSSDVVFYLDYFAITEKIQECCPIIIIVINFIVIIIIIY